MSRGRLDAVRIAAAYCGPPGSGNGGWTAGVLAGILVDRDGAASGTPVTVTLHRPPPLETDLPVLVSSAPAQATMTLPLAGRDATAAATVAEAVPALSARLDPVPPVDPATAAAAEESFSGMRHHPFPTCFVCGTQRAGHEGLALRPGRIGTDGTACTWVPSDGLADHDGRLDQAYVWAALDCPGGWSTDLDERPLVLGRITAVVHRTPTAGEHLVVVGRHLGTSGRKTLCATAVYDADGAIVGRADHVWLSIDPATFGDAAAPTAVPDLPQ